ncbi:MAG: hypothetical protein H0X13_15455 [Ramlibacter sp.]|nr:hypothetical protein [Ramlibacter sp.]
MIPLIGFAPDMDPATPGVITDCSHLIPYESGMKAAPKAVAPLGVGPLAAACTGASVLSDLSSVRRILAGTATKLYEYNGTAWADVSRAAAYTGGVDSRWSFAQFGNSAIAANGADFLQRSTGAAFADIAGSPKAEVVISIAGFLMALNFNDGTVTPDGWYCSALYDETNWALSVSTQSTKGRLISTEGKITAGKSLGSYVVAYKAKAIYVAQYVGAPAAWQWDQIIGGDAGCSGKDALVDVGGVHYFANDENFWSFDGTRPIPIATNQVRKWWLDNSDPTYRYRTIAAHDKQNNLIWFYYCSRGSGGVVDSALAYHMNIKQWGRADRSIQAAFSYVSPGVTIDGMDAYGASIDALPQVPFDSQFWLTGGRTLAVIDTANQVRQMTGAAENSTLTTGDFGDDFQVSMLRQFRPRFAKAPTTATATFSRQFVKGGDITNGSASSINDGHFKATQRARWHRARLAFTGDVSITGYQPELVRNGKR